VDSAGSLLEFARRAGPGLDGLDRMALFAQLEERHDDLLAALRWFLGQGRTGQALQLATGLARFWTASGRLKEASQCFELVLVAPGGADAHRGRACFEAGLVEFWRGRDGSGAPARMAEESGRQGMATQICNARSRRQTSLIIDWPRPVKSTAYGCPPADPLLGGAVGCIHPHRVATSLRGGHTLA
jgi:hypothetical protein